MKRVDKELVRRAQAKENTNEILEKWKKDLVGKTDDQSKLTDQINTLERRSELRRKSHSSWKNVTNRANERLIASLKTEIDEVKMKNLFLEQFETRYSKIDELVAQKQDLQKKNEDLMAQAAAGKNLHVTFEQLQASHAATAAQNLELKAQISNRWQNPGIKSQAVLETAAKMGRLKKYLSQSVSVIRTIRNGYEIDLSVLFGHPSATDLAPQSNLYESMQEIQYELEQLKGLSIAMFNEKRDSCLMQ